MMRVKQKLQLRMRQSFFKTGATAISVLILVLIAINTGIFKDSRATTLIENRWIGKKNGDFNNDKNWSLGHVPRLSEKAFLDSLSGSRVTINKRDIIEVGEIELCAGISLHINGSLIVERQVLLHSHESNLNINGYLDVKEGLYALNRSSVTVDKGATATVGKDLIIENSIIELSGGEIITENIQLRRKGAQLIVGSGSLLINNDLSIYGSLSSENSLVVNGGEIIVNGFVRYLKQTKDQNVNGRLIVNDGKFVFNELARSPNSFYFDDDYLIALNGGAIEIKNDLLFDTLENDDLIAKYGDKASIWKSNMVYERAEVDEVVSVIHDGKEYWLSQNKWKSENEEPGYSLNWLYKGKVGEPDESCSCTDVREWNENTKYIREDKDDEFFVLYKNAIYRMNKESTITRGNEPDKNGWAWTPWFVCNNNVELFRDKIEAKDGELIVHGQVLSRNDFNLKNSRLTIASGGIFSSNNNIEVEELFISNDAQISISKDLIINSDLINHNEGVVNGEGALVFAGKSSNKIKGTKALSVDNMIVNKDSADITSFIDIEIGKSLNWITPTVIHLEDASASKNKTSKKIAVTFALGADHIGNGWVNGAVRAVTDKEFEFPTGNESFSARVELSYPGEISVYLVDYANGYPPYYNELVGTLKNISKLEYWIIKTEKGNSKVVPTVYWQNSSWSNINMPKDLVLVGLQSNKWVSLGNRFCDEEKGAGNITAQKYLNDIELLTFGSIGGLNALNNENSPFATQKDDKRIKLNLTLNDDIISDVLLIKEGSNNSAERIRLNFYSTTNTCFLPDGIDLENHDVLEITTKSKKVFRSQIDNQSLSEIKVTAYPNPFTSELTLQLSETTNLEINIELFSVDGKAIFTTTQKPDATGKLRVTGLDDIKSGSYVLKIYNAEIITTTTLIKQD